MHSPEVELNEIFVSNIFSGNDINRAGPQFPNFDKKNRLYQRFDSQNLIFSRDSDLTSSNVCPLVSLSVC